MLITRYYQIKFWFLLFFRDKPIVDRSTKPMVYKNSLGPYNLRQIVVPGNLTKRFLEKAESNTFNNLETCGILAGKLVISYQKYCSFFSV